MRRLSVSESPASVRTTSQSNPNDPSVIESHAIEPKFTKRNRRIAHPLTLPRDRLAITMQKCRLSTGLSLSKLAQRSGVDVAYIWRIEQGQHQDVSREFLFLLSLAMVADESIVERVVETANEILDAAGLKLLRAPWERTLSNSKTTDGRIEK